LIVLADLSGLAAVDTDAAFAAFAGVAVSAARALIGNGDADSGLAQLPGGAVGGGGACRDRWLAALATAAAGGFAGLLSTALGAGGGRGAGEVLVVRAAPLSLPVLPLRFRAGNAFVQEWKPTKDWQRTEQPDELPAGGVSRQSADETIKALGIHGCS
jgi:hypothetical protein